MVGERALAAFLMHTPRRYLFSMTAAGHIAFDLGTRGTKPHASSKGLSLESGQISTARRTGATS